MSWKRLNSVVIPTVWSRFQGKKLTDRTGKKREYWVQDITENHKEEVLNHMVYGFGSEEPMCKYNKAISYQDATKDLRKSWEKVLEQNVGLICLTKDEDGDPQIAAMNCTSVTCKGDQLEHEINSKIVAKIFGTLDFLEAKNDAFERFGIDKYLSAMGVYVLPGFRGDGIAAEVLKAREPLCKALDIKASLSIFTSKYSQAVGNKVGFKDLYSVSYADIAKENPKLYHHNIEEHTKNIELKYICY
ncbi:uncharacterized protein [Onthophagus taurus]|uniref:uncharacterized protein n=1 Tax=Onthophagus taurus TaxID=166361 RepID=UPI000C201C04|nr:uncharacterized protein LOC111428055 [Onthophagus taurus]